MKQDQVELSMVNGRAKAKNIIYLALLLLLVSSPKLFGQMDIDNSNKLVVLWTSGDRDVAEKSCLMYSHAARKYGWFSEVTLIIWGPSAKLVIEDEAIREKVLKMQEDGVKLEACVACSNMLGVTEGLKELGVDVKGMGVALTDYLKSGYHVLTY
jgi:hypothetical protein